MWSPRAILGLTFLLAPLVAQADEAHWQGVAKSVAAAVDQVVVQYRAGNLKAARLALTEAYFGAFEESRMEAAIRQEIGSDRVAEVESMFGDLRSAIKQGDDAAVGRIAAGLHEALAADGRALDAARVSSDAQAANP